MELLISLGMAVSLFLLIYALLSKKEEAPNTAGKRLHALEKRSFAKDKPLDDMDKPFYQRVLLPLLASIGEGLAGLTPKSLQKAVETRLVMAGITLGTNEFLFIWALVVILLPMGVVSGMQLVHLPMDIVWKAGLLCLIFGALLPFVWLNNQVQARKNRIQKDLPGTLDLLTVSVEAGLGFDGALAKLTEKMKGPLVDEFGRVLKEMRMGVARRKAIGDMGRRCDVPDLSLFTAAIIQADHLGVSIGNVLRVQAVSMRERRRQRTEEKAMKAPIKMLVPLVFFIFPFLFIIILGPAVLQLMKTTLFK
ncbi:type II secretion system F family protein [Anaeromusa acidaminophila]|uniref:type II secretion system F family protein n=1 Tax=Anaeromusa acidaminophila TaxID=81464 RepID=UPI00037BD05B|nr:type II secretion system F family protein [Anaeromusa acidaminophila]